MKRYATFFLSILLLAALTACGSGSSPSGKDAPPVRTPMGTKGTEQTSDLEQAYSDLVERFRTLVSDPFGQDSDEPGEMGVLETARGMGDDAPYEMGYLIEDLSGDGIPELAVGGLRGMTNALYTLVDGKPELVFEGWYRSSYVYLGDGRFYYYGSNSAAESGQGVFALTKDGTRLECESFLFTGLNSDGDVVVYSNETGSWDIAESEKSDMTAEEFWALDPLGEPLPLIPFSRAEAGGHQWICVPGVGGLSAGGDAPGLLGHPLRWRRCCLPPFHHGQPGDRVHGAGAGTEGLHGDRGSDLLRRACCAGGGVGQPAGGDDGGHPGGGAAWFYGYHPQLRHLLCG